MTRHCTWRHIPRPSHPNCTKRIALWNNSIYYLRSVFLCRLFLSLLPLKPSPYPRTRRMLTSDRHHTAQPIRSSPTQHICSTSIRSFYHMSSPQPHRRKSKRHNASLIYHHRPRGLLHSPPSLRIFRNHIHYFRWSIRVNIFHSYRISRTPRNYWIYILTSMLYPPNEIPLYIQPSFWLRSSGMILTLRRCSLTIPLCFNLLMRIIAPLV